MRTLLLCVLAALAGPALDAAASPGGTSLGTGRADERVRATVERVAWEIHEGRARLVVGVRGAVDYSTHVASADAKASLPPRAYVDLRPAVLGKDVPRTPQAADDALAVQVRVGQFDPQTVRVVVDLREPALFEVRTSERPPRLLLGLKPRAATAVAARSEERSQVAAARVEERTPQPTAVRVEQHTPQAARAEERGQPTPARDATASPEPAATPSPQLVARAAAPTPLGSARPRATAPPPSPAATVAAPAETPAATRAVRVAAAAASAKPLTTVAPTPTPTPRRAAEKRVRKERAARKKGSGPEPTPRTWTVVLDPGHGGRDPGARGVSGDEEKAITLAISLLVAEQLADDRQTRVVLTRIDDTYVSLEQRTAIANAEGADLFVSIHANASENPRLAGVETYTLNNTDDRATIRLAALENGLALTGAAPGESDLAYILSDLVQTGKEDESVTLARAVQGNLVSYLRDRWRGVVNLGVKKGPFYVLVGAYMPCILVEVAFLTNETEGQRIAARRYQLDVAEGIARGIRRFLASETANANL